MLSRTARLVSRGGARQLSDSLTSNYASVFASVENLTDHGAVIVDCSPVAEFARAVRSPSFHGPRLMSMLDRSTFVGQCLSLCPPLSRVRHVSRARPFRSLRPHFPAAAKFVLSPQEFGAAVMQMGIGASTPVVAYDGGGGVSAARFWWVMQLYGHSNTRVLREGWKHAVASGFPVEVGPSHVSDERLEAAEADPFTPLLNPDVCATGNEVLSATSEDSETQVLDVRTVGEWVGEDLRGNPRGGHVPYAFHLPHAVLTLDGQFMEEENMVSHILPLGLDPQKRVITLCQSGVRACHTALALKALGFRDVAVYDGSMQDYLAHEHYPVAKGTARA
jgi:thiosulfate/3-mercaptopyruvate sulfurtransferase